MMKLNIQLFGHSGETDNYDLPQFVGTDKPTWLGDFNTAMSTIDSTMAENASDIESLGTRVSSAEATASQASTDVASLQSSVSSLSSAVTTATTTANNAQSTATSALNTANSADGKADTANSAIASLTPRVTACEDSIDNFNLTTFEEKTLSRVSGTFNIGTGKLTVATNSDGSLAKIYGQIDFSNITANGVAKITTDLRPENDIVISGGNVYIKYAQVSGGLNVKRFGSESYTIKTNGDVEIPVSNLVSGDSERFVFFNSLLYIKDFGDTPIVGE